MCPHTTFHCLPVLIFTAVVMISYLPLLKQSALSCMNFLSSEIRSSGCKINQTDWQVNQNSQCCGTCGFCSSGWRLNVIKNTLNDRCYNVWWIGATGVALKRHGGVLNFVFGDKNPIYFLLTEVTRLFNSTSKIWTWSSFPSWLGVYLLSAHARPQRSQPASVVEDTVTSTSISPHSRQHNRWPGGRREG